MIKIANSIEDILRVERAKANMTIEEMCDMLFISRTSYYRMKATGFKSLTVYELVALADFFNCSTDYLLGRTSDREIRKAVNKSD